MNDTEQIVKIAGDERVASIEKELSELEAEYEKITQRRCEIENDVEELRMRGRRLQAVQLVGQTVKPLTVDYFSGVLLEVWRGTMGCLQDDNGDHHFIDCCDLEPCAPELHKAYPLLNSNHPFGHKPPENKSGWRSPADDEVPF